MEYFGSIGCPTMVRDKRSSDLLIYGDNSCPGGAVPPLNEWHFGSMPRRFLLLILIAVAASVLAGCSNGTAEPENSASPLRVRLMTESDDISDIRYTKD